MAGVRRGLRADEKRFIAQRAVKALFRARFSMAYAWKKRVRQG
jgi:hypothetical protein